MKPSKRPLVVAAIAAPLVAVGIVFFVVAEEDEAAAQAARELRARRRPSFDYVLTGPAAR